MTDIDLDSLADLACEAARQAGAIIEGSRPQSIEDKAGESRAAQIVTDVDHLAQERILELLAPEAQRLGIAILSEERPDDGQRLTAPRFWSIDPLDGTLPFVEGTPGYAVSIALVARDGTPQLGVVFDPARGALYRAVRGSGFTREPSIERQPRSCLSVFADRSFDRARHLPALEAVARERGLSEVKFHVGAGAVMNACHVLDSPPACYLKLPKPTDGGGSLWDFAATACLFSEAGASVSDAFGSPLDLNRADSTHMNHRGVAFASDAQLARALRGLLTSAGVI